MDQDDSLWSTRYFTCCDSSSVQNITWILTFFNSYYLNSPQVGRGDDSCRVFQTCLSWATLFSSSWRESLGLLYMLYVYLGVCFFCPEDLQSEISGRHPNRMPKSWIQKSRGTVFLQGVWSSPAISKTAPATLLGKYISTAFIHSLVISVTIQNSWPCTRNGN